MTGSWPLHDMDAKMRLIGTITTLPEADGYAEFAESRGWFPGERFALTMRRSRIAGGR